MRPRDPTTRVCAGRVAISPRSSAASNTLRPRKVNRPLLLTASAHTVAWSQQPYLPFSGSHRRAASLVAHWMLVGFVHGVLTPAT